MRVTYTAIRFPPARGGVETYAEGMADGMAARGHDVTVVTSNLAQHLPGTLSTLGRSALGADRLKPYEIIRLAHHTLPRLEAYPFSLRGIYEIGASCPDVLHAHCFYYASVDQAAAVSLIRRIPLVLSPSVPVREGRRWQHYRRLMTWVFRRAAVTTALSQFEASLLRDSGFAPRRTVVVPPVVTARPSAAPPFDLPWSRSGHKIVLFLGRVSATKGVDTLLEALPTILRHAPEVRVVIAGPSVKTDEQALAAIIQRNRLRESVWVAGEVADERLSALFRSSDMFVFPSRYEAFGIVAIEAMAYSLPVVTSDAAALPEVLGWGERGVLHRVGNATSLASAVIELLHDEERQKELRAAGLQYVASRHNAAAQRDILEEIYSTAVRTSRPGRRLGAPRR
jgi:glycosyltransferase involved in cell wall biosynthesis